MYTTFKTPIFSEKTNVNLDKNKLFVKSYFQYYPNNFDDFFFRCWKMRFLKILPFNIFNYINIL